MPSAAPIYSDSFFDSRVAKQAIHRATFTSRLPHGTGWTMSHADTPREPIPQVLTEIQSGDGLSLGAAARLFPGHRGGAAVNPSTTFRWVKKGAKTPAGVIVKLEAVRVGGRWLTARGAVARFVAALTAAADPTPQPPPRSATERTRASAAAGRKLQDMGA